MSAFSRFGLTQNPDPQSSVTPQTLKSLENKYKNKQTLNTQEFFNYLASYCKTPSSLHIFGSPTQRKLDNLTAIAKKYTQVNISETIDQTTQRNISQAIQKGVFGDPMTDELAEKIAENLHFFKDPVAQKHIVRAISYGKFRNPMTDKLAEKIAKNLNFFKNDKNNIFNAIDKYKTYNSWINASGISEAESKIRQTILDKGTLINGNLVIQGNLYLSEPSLTSLPDNLIVNGNLNLSDCTSLTSLPDTLKAHKNLRLQHCISLTSLPNKLTVGGNLSLLSCNSLTSLPDNPTVHGDLSLLSCNSLTSLPDNLIVTGNLYISRCANLTSLPESIFNWTTAQIVNAQDTGISPELLQTYNERQDELNYQGPQLQLNN